MFRNNFLKFKLKKMSKRKSKRCATLEPEELWKQLSIENIVMLSTNGKKKKRRSKRNRKRKKKRKRKARSKLKNKKSLNLNKFKLKSKAKLATLNCILHLD